MKVGWMLALITVQLIAAVPDPHDARYDWMDPLIEKNFAPFSEGITRKTLHETGLAKEVKGNPFFTRVRVTNNRVYTVQGEGGAIMEMVQYLADTYGLPHLDFFYFSGDGLGYRNPWDRIGDYIDGGAPI